MTIVTDAETALGRRFHIYLAACRRGAGGDVFEMSDLSAFSDPATPIDFWRVVR